MDSSRPSSTRNGNRQTQRSSNSPSSSRRPRKSTIGTSTPLSTRRAVNPSPSSLKSASSSSIPTDSNNIDIYKSPTIAGLKVPVFVGIIAGGCLIVALIILLAVLLVRQQKRKKTNAVALSDENSGSLPDYSDGSINKSFDSNEKTESAFVTRQPSRFLPRSLSKRNQGHNQAVVVPFDVAALEGSQKYDNGPETPTSAVPLIAMLDHPYAASASPNTETFAEPPTRPERSLETYNLFNDPVSSQQNANNDGANQALANSTSTVISGPPAYARSSYYDETMDVEAFDTTNTSMPANAAVQVGLARADSLSTKTFVASRQPISTVIQPSHVQYATVQNEAQNETIAFSDPPARNTNPIQQNFVDGSYFPPQPSPGLIGPSDSQDSLAPLVYPNPNRTVGQAPALYSRLTNATMSIHSEMAELGGLSPGVSPVKALFSPSLSAEPPQTFNPSMQVSADNEFAPKSPAIQQIPSIIVPSQSSSSISSYTQGPISRERQRQATNGTVASEAEAPFSIGSHLLNAVITPPVSPVMPEVSSMPTIEVQPSSLEVSEFPRLSQMGLSYDNAYRSATYSVYDIYSKQ